MKKIQDASRTPLPTGWGEKTKSGMLHVLALAQWAIKTAQASVEHEGDANPYEIQIGRLENKIRLLQEQARIKDGRMERVSAARRPHYSPVERLEILELRAANGWSRRQTGREFLIAAATVSTWLKRIDEEGSQSMLQLPQPVNKFPDLVRYTIGRLKTVCPQLGKVKIAQMLCRAGLHLSVSTVGRINKQANEVPTDPNLDPKSEGEPDGDTKTKLENQKSESDQLEDAQSIGSASKAAPLIVTAKSPNHVWHVDLTTVPIGGGFWTPWVPFTLPQCWPFCWWVAIVMDHYSRKVIGFAVFKQQPTSLQVRTFLGRAMGTAKATPKYIISDKGVQFWNAGYKKWCKQRKIKPRFGAIGQHGGIAVIERLNRTFKEFTRSLAVVPMIQERFRAECSQFIDWYNEHRPHTTLSGKTPNEVYSKEKFPANRRPRIEPRENWPRPSRCAMPQVLVSGQPGDRFALQIEFFQGNHHLPIVTLNRIRRAA